MVCNHRGPICGVSLRFPNVAINFVTIFGYPELGLLLLEVPWFMKIATIQGLVLASHQLLAIPAARQQHLQPHLVIYYDDSDPSYIQNYGSKYALQHGYPHALPYSMQYPKATSSI